MQNHGHVNYLMRLNSILMFQKGDILKVAIFAFAVAVLSLVIPIAVENLVNTVALAFVGDCGNSLCVPGTSGFDQGHAVLSCGVHAKKAVRFYSQKIKC